MNFVNKVIVILDYGKTTVARIKAISFIHDIKEKGVYKRKPKKGIAIYLSHGLVVSIDIL